MLDLFRTCFAVFFFLVRVVLNTYVVVGLFRNRHYLDESAIPPAGQYVLLGLLPMLQLLNFFWFYKIVGHALNPKPKKDKAVAGASAAAAATALFGEADAHDGSSSKDD